MRLSQCDVGSVHPAMVIEAMDYIGFRWYHGYVVYEEYRDFNQQQYRAMVYIYPNDIKDSTCSMVPLVLE